MTTPRTLRELLPCPFCGKPAKLEDFNDHHGEWFNLGCSDNWQVAQNSKGCPGGLIWYTAEPEDKEAAIEAWNQRATLATKGEG